MLDPSALSPALSGRGNIRYLSRVFGVDIPESEVLNEAGLDVDERVTGRYSLGMRSRLAIAFALSLQPRLLLLDEPFNGLDPPGLRWARNAMVAVVEAGGTVVLSSHLLHELGTLCTDVTVLHEGRQVFTGTAAELLRAGSGDTVIVTVDRAAEARAADVLRTTFAEVERRGGGQFAVTGADPAEVNRTLGAAGIWAGELLPERSLEAVYLRIIADVTGQTL